MYRYVCRLLLWILGYFPPVPADPQLRFNGCIAGPSNQGQSCTGEEARTHLNARDFGGDFMVVYLDTNQQLDIWACLKMGYGPPRMVISRGQLWYSNPWDFEVPFLKTNPVSKGLAGRSLPNYTEVYGFVPNIGDTWKRAELGSQP